MVIGMYIHILKILFMYFKIREREREEEREGEKHQCVRETDWLPLAGPNWGLGQQPRHVT